MTGAIRFVCTGSFCIHTISARCRSLSIRACTKDLRLECADGKDAGSDSQICTAEQIGLRAMVATATLLRRVRAHPSVGVWGSLG